MPLFDTTFIVDLARSDPGAIRLAEEAGAGDEVAALSVLSVHEYLVGVHRTYGTSPKETLHEKLAVAESHVGKFQVVPLTIEIVRVSAALQAELARLGRQIGSFDLLVAATALAGGLPIVTRDKAFSRVPKLRVESY